MCSPVHWLFLCVVAATSTTLHASTLSSITTDTPDVPSQTFSSATTAGTQSKPTTPGVTQSMHPISTSTHATQTLTTAPATVKPCQQRQVDVGFLLDSSASEGAKDVQAQVNFVEAFVSQLNISQQAMQVGLVTYDTEVHPQFLLNRYQDQSSVLAALSTANPTTGASYTGRALHYMRTLFFSPTYGARAGVPKVLIVLTDGKSTNSAETQHEASLLKEAGVQIIAVGPKSPQGGAELTGMASNPENAITVTHMDVLLSKIQNVTDLFCHYIDSVKGEPAVMHTTRDPADCVGRPADVVLILDSSASEGPISFRRQKDFVINLTSQLDIGPSDTQIGLVTYSTFADNVFYLNQHASKAEVLNALEKVAFQSGASYTGDALWFVRTHSLLTEHGHRQTAQPVVIVLTDGESSDSDQTKREAALLKAKGAVVFAVAIGSQTDGKELAVIATDSAYVYSSTSFNFLSTIANQIAAEIKCGAFGPLPTELPVCLGTEAADILFFLDASLHSSEEDFSRMVKFAIDMIDGFSVGPDKMQFGVVTYASQPNSEFWLNSYTDTTGMIAELQTLKGTGGSARLDEALKFAREYAYAPFHGARDDKPNYAFIITDSGSVNAQETILQANQLKQQGVMVMVVGVGDQVDKSELNAIASESSQVFLVPDYTSLANLPTQVKRRICNSINLLSSSTTAPGMTEFVPIIG